MWNSSKGFLASEKLAYSHKVVDYSNYHLSVRYTSIEAIKDDVGGIGCSHAGPVGVTQKPGARVAVTDNRALTIIAPRPSTDNLRRRSRKQTLDSELLRRTNVSLRSGVLILCSVGF